MPLLSKLIKYTTSKNASDLHIVSGNYAFMRVNGDMIPITEAGIIDSEKANAMMIGILPEKSKKELEENLQTDFALEFDEQTRYRINLYQTHKGLAGAFRQIPAKIQTLEEIRAPEVLKDLVRSRNGLVLVCGPTGSGKSTTLAAMVDYRNKNYEDHIITIEDPLEFVHKSQLSLINHREIGKSAKTFSDSLRGALREDPDVIMVGEMRDKETIQLALTAAETGHLVFATLHTASAAKTIDRIVDVFNDSEKNMIRSMLSTSLRGVVSQTLVKRKDGQGRVPIHEVMIVNTSVGNLIRENKIAQIESMMQIGSRYGMITLKEQAKKLYDEGIVDWQDVENILSKKGENDKIVNGLSKEL